MDLFIEGLLFARGRTNSGLVQGDIHTPPFDTSFQLVGLFDVIEHLSDDEQVLRDIHALLADDGTLLVTVPAHRSLWSYFDAGHHFRRYSLQELERKLQAAGYSVEFLTQYMASIFPLVWFGRRLAGLADRRPKGSAERTHDLTSQELHIVPGLNAVLTWLLTLEARWLAGRRRLPIGTSLLAIARKRNA
jgi:SAM-dependent methyltransferase